MTHSRWLTPVALAALLSTGVAARIASRADASDGLVPEGAACSARGPGTGGSVLRAAVVSEADELGFPTRLLVQGPWALVLDAASDSVLHLIRLPNGALYQSLGRRGRGPGEFWSAWSLSYDSRSGDAWIYDVSLARFTSIAFPRGGTQHAHLAGSLQLVAGGIATGAAWLDAKRVLAPGFYQDARVAVLDGSGRRVGGIGRSPLTESTPYPQVSQARLALDPDGHLAVLADRHLASIELIDLDRATSRTVNGPVALPHASAPPGVDDVAYVDVTATSQSIFGLFSGRSFSGSKLRASFGDCVHVFGWDGAFQGAFRLDGDVIAIAVTQDGSALYALRHDPRPALVRFDLPVVTARR
jgi:hypothetical protein